MKSSNLIAEPHLPREHLTFDQAENSCHKTTSDEVAYRYCGPMSTYPVISINGHSEVIWVRLDMATGAVANSISFVVGSSPRKIPWREVKF